MRIKKQLFGWLEYDIYCKYATDAMQGSPRNRYVEVGSSIEALSRNVSQKSLQIISSFIAVIFLI